MNVWHPIPYQGSKRNLARYILQYVPSNADRLVEPFAGSAAVSLAAATSKRISRFWINDLNAPLCNLWSRIIDQPETIAQSYRDLWEEQEGQERTYYDEVRARFNQTHEPELLLYLLARCVKASVRYNSNGEFNQSPDNRRKGARPSTMKAQILGASSLLRGKTLITNHDFRDVLLDVTPTDIVYMDPPYQGVASNRDSRYIGTLDYDGFVCSLEALIARDVSFIISYDGRTGAKKFGNDLPSQLGLTHKEINAGKSSQATLLGRDEDTYESLYLSPALIERLEGAELRETQLSLSLMLGEETEASARIPATVGVRYQQAG